MLRGRMDSEEVGVIKVWMVFIVFVLKGWIFLGGRIRRVGWRVREFYYFVRVLVKCRVGVVVKKEGVGVRGLGVFLCSRVEFD